MKKLVAFILVLALCLSLCSVALATPAPEAPSSCNINILHAIGAYWIARTIVERAKEVEVETVNLSDFLKWALPVGIAAVGTAATVHFFYHLLKDCGGNTEDSNFTVTFDLNGITGTTPPPRTIKDGEKATKPADPTDTVHAFADWYKTKNSTTGELTDKWDFDNDTVTEDMTLYAQWIRTLESIYANSDIPKVTDNTTPDNAWVNGQGGKAFIAFSENNAVLFLTGTNTLPCGKGENFTKIGDDYVLDYYVSDIFRGKYTLHMTDNKFTSVTYDGAGTIYNELSGTYTAPTN